MTEATAPVPRAAPVRSAQDAGDVPWLIIRGARHNNLKNIDAAFPIGRFTCVTGVSGSGKSSLVNDILYQALARDLNGATTTEPGAHGSIVGLRHLDKVIAIDQTPIGRTPRSNPATYIKVFDEIRALFAKLPDAKLRGYKSGRFSFNVPVAKGGGRCEACEGNGANRIGMDFLADVWVRCPVCEGRRFGRETLQIRFKGKNIYDVLEMEVRDALDLFDSQVRIHGMLQTLHDVGLDYIRLGQSSTTLSGGEAQRIKLARELVKKATGRTLYVLDEPTTGLHFEDVRKLLEVLHGFVDDGNTVVVIEHNLDVLKTADWIIDLGPEGGEAGGRIVAEGTPERVAETAGSFTGEALRGVLRSEKPDARRETRAGCAAATGLSDASPVRSRFVSVRGAKQHNLKDVSIAFPRDRMTVCTGVSGSGKTSFAVDTVFTEGYRRYVESLSAYARQFLGQLQKPRVDHIEGLSPAICIEQRSASRSPRSTVGTVTEIYDYMRVLWARVGQRYCPRCVEPIGTQTVDEIVARVMGVGEGAPIILLAPIALGDGETYAGLFNRLKASGYTRVRIDGQIRLTAECTTLDPRRRHRVEVLVDRTVVREKSRSRISESVEHALGLGNGVMTLLVEPVEIVTEEAAEAPAGDSAPGITLPARHAPIGPTPHPPAAPPVHTPAETMFSQKLACLKCGTSYEELGPNHYSFNHQLGWCETCEGLGVQRGAAQGEVIKNPARSLFNGAIAGWPRIEPRTPMGKLLTQLCRHLHVEPGTPLRDWTGEQKRALMFGTDSAWIDSGDAFNQGRHASGVRFRWRGFFPAMDHATRNSWSFRHKLRNVVTDIPCVTCRGGRLRADAAATRLGGRTITEICDEPLTRTLAFFRGLKLDRRERHIAGEVLKEITSRLQFLIDVGLDYLTLHRAAPTLSGGESQRIRLASQIGSGLTGVLYVLDEPTIGLHPRDTMRLINALAKLRDLGNTLLLVEHDRDVIAHADRILDFGPRAGRDGGQIVADATPAEMKLEPRSVCERPSPPPSEPQSASEPSGRRKTADSWTQSTAPSTPAHDSLTRAYLSGSIAIPIPSNRRPVDRSFALEIIAASSVDATALHHSEPRPQGWDESEARPQGRASSEAQPQGRASSEARPQGRASSEARPQGRASSEARPQGRASSEAQPQGRAPSEARPQGRASSEAQPQGRAPSEARPQGRASPDAEPINGPIFIPDDAPAEKSHRRPRTDAKRERDAAAIPGWLVIRGARQNNLKDLSVPIPLARLVVVTGVSGSGKSSLVNDILYPAIARELHGTSLPVGEHDRIDGVSQLLSIVNVDQSPIGTTPSSNPATYTGVFDQIRELFARLPESKLRGWNANRFSFNRPGGRCEACEGQGQRCIEMHFMADVWVECETCRGRRYNPETLEVRFKGKNIADVLEMRVAEALEHFAGVPRVKRMLRTLSDIGLDYVPLGQSATTLSGGEAQRVKLAAELGKPQTGRTLYILDEPTTGLHFDDVRKLLAILHRLVDLGNSVLVVEHNLDVIKNADFIIELGPEAGDAGGHIVALGTPEEICSEPRLQGRAPSEAQPQGRAPSEARPQGRAPSEARPQGRAPCEPQPQTSAISEPRPQGRAPSEPRPQGRGESEARPPGRGNAEVESEKDEVRKYLSSIPAASVGSSVALLSSHFARSATADALAPILAAGPYVEREPFDAATAAEEELAAERAGFGDVGKEVRMPWQVDGRKWHLEQRRSRDEAERKWEPEALLFVLELIEKEGAALAKRLGIGRFSPSSEDMAREPAAHRTPTVSEPRPPGRGASEPRPPGRGESEARPQGRAPSEARPPGRAPSEARPSGRGASETRPQGRASNLFAPVNWNDRASVEVTAPGAQMWFLHALTGGEWLIELYFRVPPKTFKWPQIDYELGLKTLDEREDLQTYGDWSRVDVRQRQDGWDAVVVYAHDRNELDTPAFRRFIKKAVAAYAAGIAKSG